MGVILLAPNKLSYLYNYSILGKMHKLNKFSRYILTIDYVIEATFTVLADMLTPKYPND